jgi:hypothetical protein
MDTQRLLVCLLRMVPMRMPEVIEIGLPYIRHPNRDISILYGYCSSTAPISMHRTTTVRHLFIKRQQADTRK